MSLSPASMKEYLKHALEFEKYVYVWSNAMNNANAEMKNIYAERAKLQRAYNDADISLGIMDDLYDSDRISNSNEAQKYSKRANIARTVWFVSLAFCALSSLAALMLLLKVKNESGSDFPFVLLLLGSVFFGVITYFTTFFGPIAFGIYISDRAKSKKCLEKMDEDLIRESKERNAVLEADRRDKAQTGLAVIAAKETALKEKQNEIFVALQKAKKTLNDIYSLNVLPARYRSFNAVATLYEYLDTGRCTIITGHGGIYDTYEHDLQMGLIIQNLSDIRNTLYRIEGNQQTLYQELRQANATLSSINTNLKDVQETNRQIAHNTAISAEANRQTAAATQYLAWQARFL